VSDPGGGVTFTTSASLLTAINANPAGTKFIHAAGGTEDWSAGLSVPTGKAPRIYFLGLAGSTATTLVGNGRTVGFDCFAAGGMEIRGGTYTDFGTLGGPGYAAAINGRGPFTVEDAKFDACYKGVGYDGTGAAPTDVIKYTRCYAVDCLRYGFTISGFTASGPEISYCHWKNNNTALFDPANDAGGSKFLVNDCWVHHCWVESNQGSGIWTDFSSNDVVIEENVSENNTWWGIFYEVGGPGAHSATGIIRHNYCANNGAGAGGSWYNSGQILASCDDGQRNGGTGFDVSFNLIDVPVGSSAVALGWVDHSSHPYNVKSGLFHDNDVWLRGTQTGRVGGYNADLTSDPFSVAYNNHFENNSYHVTNTALAKWYWGDPGVGAPSATKTWAQWQAYGNDDTGSVVLI
jgi:hypothetical protein